MIHQRLYHPNSDQPDGPYLEPDSNNELSEKNIFINLLNKQLEAIEQFRPSIRLRLKRAIFLDFEADSILLDEMYTRFMDLLEEREEVIAEKCSTVTNHDNLIPLMKRIDIMFDELINLTFQATKESYNPGKIFKLIVKLTLLYKQTIRIVK